MMLRVQSLVSPTCTMPDPGSSPLAIWLGLLGLPQAISNATSQLCSCSTIPECREWPVGVQTEKVKKLGYLHSLVPIPPAHEYHNQYMRPIMVKSRCGDDCKIFISVQGTHVSQGQRTNWVSQTSSHTSVFLILLMSILHQSALTAKCFLLFIYDFIVKKS